MGQHLRISPLREGGGAAICRVEVQKIRDYSFETQFKASAQMWFQIFWARVGVLESEKARRREKPTSAGRRRSKGAPPVQGYLAHKKQLPP